MNWLFAAVVMLGAPIDDGVVLLDFQASWCGPCQQMAPTVDQLSLDGYNVRKIDIDRDRDLAKRFKVANIPCFVVLIDGREVSRVTGLSSYDHLRNLLDQAAAKKALSQQKAPPVPVAAMPYEMPYEMPGGPNSDRWGSRARSQVMPSTATAPVFTGSQPTQPMVPITSVPDTRIVPVSHQVETDTNRRSLPVTEEELISCTVRIRVKDPHGRSSGTGTIIDSRRGWALALTCGHLFRDSKGDGEIEVEMFVDGRIKKVKGTLRLYNLDRDLGLVSFQTDDQVRVARVALPEFDAQAGQSVAGVGCSHGENPTIMFTRVVSKNSIVGPPNLKTAGLSVEGRSGGGLFSKDGMLLGVCNFAMPSDNAAVFAASESIRAELDRAGLNYVYKNPQGTLLSDPASNHTPLVAYTPSMPERMPAASAPRELTGDGPQPTAHVQPPSNIQPSTNLSSTAAPGMVQESLTLEEAAALEEIRRRRAAGYEVIFIMRSRANPSAETEIIVLDKASPAFFQNLARESGSVTR